MLESRNQKTTLEWGSQLCLAVFSQLQLAVMGDLDTEPRGPVEALGVGSLEGEAAIRPGSQLRHRHLATWGSEVHF